MKKALAVAVILLLCPIVQVLPPQPIGDQVSQLLAALSSQSSQTVQSPPWWETATNIAEFGPGLIALMNMGSSGVGNIIKEFGLEYAQGAGGPEDPFGGLWLNGINDFNANGVNVAPSFHNYVPTGESSQFLSYYDALPPQQKWRFPNGTIIANPITAGSGYTFDGCLVKDPDTSFPTEVSFDPSNPYWADYLGNQSLQAINHGIDSIYLDNLVVSPFTWMGDFGFTGSWFDYNFNRFLATIYSPAQLASMGVNLGTFNFTDYLKTHFQITSVDKCGQVNFGDPNDVRSDPIVQDWLFFQYKIQMDFVEQLSESIHDYAASLGRQVIFSGNMGEYSFSPLSIPLMQYQDVITLEVFDERGFYPPYGSPLLDVKTALAATDYSKPVWVFTDYNGPLPPTQYSWLNLQNSSTGYNGSLPANLSYLFQLEEASTFAAGGIREVSFNTGWNGSSTSSTRMLGGTESSAILPYLSFVDDAKGLLIDSQPTARIALVSSLPSQYWNDIPALGFSDWSESDDVRGWANMLESNHLNYDVVIFGQPGLFNDTQQLARLNNYDLVILPSVEVLSSAQIEALQNYVSHGGHLIISGGFGQRDTQFQPIDPSRLSAITSSPQTQMLPNLGTQYWVELLYGESTAQTYSAALSSLNAALPAPQILTNAPPRVTMNLVAQPALNSLVLNVVNLQYGANQTRDWVTDADNITVSLKVDPSYPARGAFIISPESPDPVPISYTLQNGYVKFTIPKLHVWDMVVFGMSPSEYDTMRTAGRLVFTLLPSQIAKPEALGLNLSSEDALAGRARAEYLAGDYSDSISSSIQAANTTANAFDRFGQLLTDEPSYLRDLSALNSEAKAGNFTGALSSAGSAIGIGVASLRSIFGSVAFDEGHNDQATVSPTRAPQVASDLRFDMFAADLNETAYAVSSYTKNFTGQALSKYQILVLTFPNQTLSQGEIQAVLNFISQGGGLLVIGSPFVDPQYVNSLTEHFGVTYLDGCVQSAQATDCLKANFDVTDIDQSNPVTAGVTYLHANNAVPMVIQAGYGATTIAYSGNDTYSGSVHGPFPFIVTEKYGEGRIVFLSGSFFIDFWYQLGTAAHILLARNAMAWLSQPSSAGKTLLLEQTAASGSRVNVGSNQTVAFRVVRATDGSYPTGAALVMGYSTAIVQASGWANFSISQGVSGMVSYLPTAGSDSAGVLRVADASGGPASVIWDRVDVVLSTTTPSLTVGSNASITWTAYYEYDKTPFNGRITLNDTTSKNLPGVYRYTVSRILDNKYALTVFMSNTVSIEFLSQQPSTTTTTATTSTAITSTSVTVTSSTPPISASSTTEQTATTTTGGGIPEFPYQMLAVALFTVLLVVSYLAIRHRRTSFSR